MEKERQTKVLVTGASGFIGSFLVEGGLEQGMQVWAGIRRTSSRKYLQDERIRIMELDLEHPDTLRSQLKAHRDEHGSWDVIIHCAGVTKCVRSEDFDKGNYVCTYHLVETLRQLDMVPRQFIYLSSLSVYGPVHEEDYTPIGEDDSPQPNTAYARSKLKTEQYLQGIPDFPYVILRPTGVYGPRERDYLMMFRSIKRHIDFSAGRKLQILTFVYVKDLVQVAYLAVKHQVSRRAYFVTDGRSYPSRTFSELIQRTMGISFVLHLTCPLIVLKLISVWSECLSSLTGRASTLNKDKYNIMKQRNWQCDITRLKEDLAYCPKYSLAYGVEETVAWYKKEKWL